MLDPRAHDVPAPVCVGARRAEDGQIVGFRGAGGEDDLFGGGADQRRDLGPRPLDALRRAAAEDVRDR